MALVAGGCIPVRKRGGARLWRAGAQPCAFAQAEGCEGYDGGEKLSRNADFIFIAEGDTTTLGPKGRRPFLHNLPPKAAITLGPQGPVHLPL